MIRLRNLERSYPLSHGKFFYVLRDINIVSAFDTGRCRIRRKLSASNVCDQADPMIALDAE
jgi:hypothetical protein